MSQPYLTTWSEERVLAYFWTMVHADADRVALLKQISGVAIERPDDWDRAGERAAATPKTRATTICFSCFTGDRRLYWHHVIAIQHGGSTCLRNLVPICLRCHALKVERVVLSDITTIDVYREGFGNLTQRQFVEMFKKHMGGLKGQVVTRIEFEYVDAMKEEHA